MALDIARIRGEFPCFTGEHPPIYFDSAATTQIPAPVLAAMREYEEHGRANVHRGMHALAEHATELYEEARKTMQQFVHAKYADEIVFTKSCTESINLVARGCTVFVGKQDRVATTLLEHHSNIVPWFQQRDAGGAEVLWVDIDDMGNVQTENLAEQLTKQNVKLVAVTGQSNVLGIRPDLKEIIRSTHACGALVLVDAAQLAAHHQIDVQALDCDFLTFSSHKLYGPTGIGVLYGKRELLAKLPPLLGGGGMVRTVTQRGFLPEDAPQKFEAGSPPVAQAIGLAAAATWLQANSWKDIEDHETAVLAYAKEALRKIEGVHLLPGGDSGCVSFTIDGAHPHDITALLGKKDIALRAGHHCAQPLHDYLKIPSSIRLAVGIYNTKEEVDTFTAALKNVLPLLATR